MKLKQLPIPYRFAILGGFALGAIFALKTYLMYLYWDELDYFKWEKHLMVPIVNYTFWGILFPLVYFLVSRYKLQRSSTARERWQAILASVLMAVVHEFITNLAYFLPMHYSGLRPFTNETFSYVIWAQPWAIFNRLIEYWIIYALISAVDYQRKFHDKQVELAQLESQLSGAKLSALRLQLQPHFLFNTLNTISSLMEIDVRRAQKMVSKLGSLLRSVLDRNRNNWISLNEEIEFIKSYLDIESVRFYDRLKVIYEVDDEVLNCRVPALILQPLVENAVKHGFANQTGEGTITLTARKKGDRLWLCVRDDGRGAPTTDNLFEKGLGLKNVRDRLRLLYKEEFELQVKSASSQGFEVRMIIPFRELTRSSPSTHHSPGYANAGKP